MTTESTPHRETFKSRTLAGVRWSFVEQFGNQFLQFLTTVVLARLLSPADFGLMSMILVFTGFAALFADFGLGAALIQREQVRPEHLDSAFWVNIGAGATLAALIAATSPLIAAVYGEPALQPLTAFVALSFLFSSSAIVQRARMAKAMDFRRLALAAVGAKLVVGSLGIALALRGLGVWSLAIASVTGSAFTAALLWYWSDWRPRRRLDRGALLELWGFSSHYFGFQAVNYWLRNADNFLVGKYLGTPALGLYTRAYALLLMPVHFGSSLSRVMFPALSTIQTNPARVGRVYLRMCQVTAFVTAPLMFGLFAVAEPFVLVVFGARWAPMVEVLRILCLVGFLQSVGTLVGNLFLSTGRSDLMFWVGCVTGVLGVVAMVLGLRHGITGVATYYAAVSLLAFLPQQHLALRLVGLSVSDLLAKLWRPTSAAAGMGGLVFLLGQQLPSAWPLSLRLALQVSSGALLYVSLAHFSGSESYLELRAQLRKRGASEA